MWGFYSVKWYCKLCRHPTQNIITTKISLFSGFQVRWAFKFYISWRVHFVTPTQKLYLRQSIETNWRWISPLFNHVVLCKWTEWKKKCINAIDINFFRMCSSVIVPKKTNRHRKSRTYRIEAFLLFLRCIRNECGLTICS